MSVNLEYVCLGTKHCEDAVKCIILDNGMKIYPPTYTSCSKWDNYNDSYIIIKKEFLIKKSQTICTTGPTYVDKNYIRADEDEWRKWLRRVST